jgi:hypothetical protein
MHIRYRNGHIEFLRSVKKELKSGVRSVGQLIKKEDFTQEEQAQYDEHMKIKNAALDAENMKFFAEHPYTSLKRISDGFNAGYKPENEASFWLIYDELKKSIRKTKMKRPKAEKNEE